MASALIVILQNALVRLEALENTETSEKKVFLRSTSATKTVMIGYCATKRDYASIGAGRV